VPLSSLASSTPVVDFIASDPTGMREISSFQMTSSGPVLLGYEMCSHTTYGTQSCSSSGTTPPSTPIGYENGYTDPSGLVYLINRYYDPSLREFISVDPAYSQTHQLYGYANENPVNGSDPSGLYGYKDTFDLGFGETPSSYLRALLYFTNLVFPFPVELPHGGLVADHNGGLQYCHEYFINTFGYHNPVLVTGLTSTSLSLLSLPGHLEGAGNTITFSFFYGKKTGDTYLRVQASGPMQWFDHIPAYEGARQNLATIMWADLAVNLFLIAPEL
ncbi:MAG: RHS repeat-associated core domain-containing protein, partial [Acidimicrobiales bacterium]